MITTKWIEGEKNLEDVHHIRRKVFIAEQGVSEEDEMDGTDTNATHLLVYENEIPVATGRILLEGEKCVLGRIAVLKEHRGKKYGDFVMRILIRTAYNRGFETQYIHAQIQASSFYEKLGFIRYGEEFMDAGIPHINMKHEGDVHPCNSDGGN